MVNKKVGFLNKSTFSDTSGGTSRETDTEKYFLSRDEAFQYAIDKQSKKVEYAKLTLIRNEETLGGLFKAHSTDGSEFK